MSRQWITPITDRSNIDISRRTPKGYLNVVDIRRIESNIAYLSEQLREHGFRSDVATPNEWSKDDIVKVSDLESIRDSIISIMETYYMLDEHARALQAITFESLNFTNVNDIERTMFDLHRLLTSTESITNLSWAMGMAHTGLYVSV